MAKRNKSVANKRESSQNSQNLPSGNWLPWILSGVAFLLFASGFQNEMLAIDDHTATVNNPAVTDFKLFSDFNLGMFAPVTWFGYSIAYLLGEESSFWYHFLSAAVHAVNVWLVFHLFRDLGSNTTAAAFIAFLFGIHPLQVESVAWIAGFSTPLFVCFSLVSMRYYIRYTGEDAMGRSYWLSLGAFLLACLSKSAAVTLPLTLLVLDWWLKRPIGKKTLMEKVPFFLLALGFGALTLISRQHDSPLDQPADFSVFDRFLMACYSVLFYWKKILFPTGLSIWYPFEKQNGGWHWMYYASPAVLAGILFFAWKSRGKMPFLWWGILFYLSAIVLSLPWATLGTFEMRFDRYNYMPILGILSILVALPAYFSEHKPTWVNTTWVLLSAAAVVWLLAAGLRVRDWRSTRTLIDSALATTGDNFGKAYLWRGIVLADDEKYNDAIQDFNRAITINPSLYEAYKQRGNLMGPMKNYEQALADLNIYLEKNPTAAPEYYNRGLSLVNLGKDAEALADFNKCIELDPTFERAYRARGNTYLKLGEKEKGDADLKEFERLQAK